MGFLCTELVVVGRVGNDVGVPLDLGEEIGWGFAFAAGGAAGHVHGGPGPGQVRAGEGGGEEEEGAGGS